MAQLPPVSNVFGYLHSTVGLEPVQEALRSRLGMTTEQVRIQRSAMDGSQTLQIETSDCSLEIRPFKKPNTWQFTGAVAGNADEIFETLLPIVQNLKWAGFSATFEIYDASFQFVGNCPRDEVQPEREPTR
jgi:hypothetical protein